MNRAPKTANATYAATIVDQLVRDGLTHAFVAPGSRSTPLAIALVSHPQVHVEVCHDERVASFAALGFGSATGRAALVLCSSGTAGAHFYAAVIEADASAIPLLVCTADRPPELWGRGAPQTIDQSELYGSRVRDFVEPGPPDDTDPDLWRPLARRLWQGTCGATPGPVHANLSFRDPLTGTPGELTAPLADLPTESPAVDDDGFAAELAARLVGRRGIIIAGRHESEPASIVELASRLGWPLLADHRSGCRPPDLANVISRFDSLLRHEPFAQTHRPDTVLRIGEIVSSKSLSLWLSTLDADVIASKPHGRNIDPEDIATTQFNERGVLQATIDQLPNEIAQPAEWLDSWIGADRAAEDAIARTLAETTVTEVGVARAVLDAIPAGGALVASSSMPVRDIEWFGANRDDIAVIANRGANGIDGIVATALGVALSGRPTMCLIGDVAFLHDSTALIGLRDRPVDLTIVVIDNDGGGIFSFLPQHDLLDAETYEQLFGTPHHTDLGALAAAHGLQTESWPTELSHRGVRVVLASSTRDSNLNLHKKLHRSAAAAVSAVS